MNYDSRQELEPREPEKTPLIDMVFLLLIFFFVNLAIRWGPTASRTAKLPSDIQAELPKVPAPDLVSDSAIVLLEVLDTEVSSMYNRLAALRGVLQNCSSKCGTSIPPQLGLHRFWVTTVSLDSLEAIIQQANGCDCTAARWLADHFPIPLDDAQIRAKLDAYLNALPARGSLRLHVRMPRSTPVSFLKTLYELANQNRRIKPKYVFVRALEERM